MHPTSFPLRPALALFLLAFGGVAFAAGRTVEVKAFDRATGAVTLSFGAAEGDDGNLLYALCDVGDRGVETVEAWKRSLYLGKVNAETTGEYAVPGEWLENPCAIRFVLTGAHDRPFDYRAEELVSKDNATYIDTGVVPNAATATEAVFSQPRGDTAIFGISGVHYLFSNGGATYYAHFQTGGSFEDFYKGDASKFHALRLGPDGAWVDGVRKAGPFTAPALTTTSTITLFGRRNDGTSTINKGGTLHLRSANIVKDGVKVRDFIPCVKDGVGYLYDRVGKALYPCQGGGAFTYVGDLGSETPEDVVGWSSAVKVGREVTVGAFDPDTGTVEVSLAGGAWSGRLFAVHDVADKGLNPKDWKDAAYLDRLPADAETCAAKLPSDWLAGAGAVRFVWVSDAEAPYDCEISSVTSKGASDADNKGSPNLDTGVVPHLGTSISVLSFLPTESVDCAFGLSTVMYCFVTGKKSDLYYYGFFDKAGNKSSGKPYGAWRTVEVGPDGVSVDGVLLGGPFTDAGHVVPYYPLILFGRRNNGTGAYEKHASTISIRRAKIWDGKTLVRDYIACSKDGKPYLYDRVNGVFHGKDGYITGSELTPEIAGDEALSLSDALAITTRKEAVWIGAGGDTKFSTQANWRDGAAVDGETVATFAQSGETATVDAPTALAGVVFDAPNDFTLDAAGGGSLALGAAGFSLKAKGDATRYLNVRTPLTVAYDQDWKFAAGATARLNIQGPISGDAERTVTVSGPQYFGVYSTNTGFKGSFVIKDGVLCKLFSRRHMFGESADGSSVTIYLRDNAVVDFFGAVIDKPLAAITGSNRAAKSFITHSAGASADVSWGAETDFTAPVTISGTQTLIWEVGQVATNVFSGDLTATCPLMLISGATRIRRRAFLTEPVTLEGAGTELWLEASSNVIRQIDFAEKSSRCQLHLTAYNAAWWNTNGLSFFAPKLNVSTNGTVNLHGTYQTFCEVELPEGGRIVGGEGSTFRALPSTRNVIWEGTVEDGVALSKGGGSVLTLNARNTSTGALLANNGLVRIDTNGYWAGTEVELTANAGTAGERRLELRSSDALAAGRRVTMRLNGAAQVNLAEGVAQRIGQLLIDGKIAEAGTWGASGSDAEHKDDLHFAGLGVLEVVGKGMTVIVR